MTAAIQSSVYGVSITVQATGNHYSPDVMNDLSGRVVKVFADVIENLEEYEEFEEQPAPNVIVKVQDLIQPDASQ